jgi:hypothetical protein
MATPVPCDAASLIAGAQCIAGCIPPGMQFPVLASLLCQIANNGGTGGGGAANFVSADFPLTSAAIMNTPHGLGAQPKNVQGFVVCAVADANTGYQPGDLIQPFGFYDPNAGTMVFTVWATATNVGASSDAVLVGNEANYGIVVRGGGVVTNPSSWTNFRFRIYASL